MARQLNPNHKPSEAVEEVGKHAVKKYLEDNAERVKTWAKDHPGERPPVFYIEDRNEVVWLTRKQRRAMDRKMAKNQMRRIAQGERDSLLQSISQEASTRILNQAKSEPLKEDADETTRTETAYSRRT